MAVKEYKQIDLETGIILDTCLFDVDKEYADEEGNLFKLPLPEDYVEGWGAYRQLFNPVYDFELQDWTETKPQEEIVQHERQLKDAELNELCRQSILAGFTHTIDGIEYQFSYDSEAQQNFTDAMTALGQGLIQSIGWTVKKEGEYTRIQITPEIMNELKIVILMHKDSNISKYRDVLMKAVTEAQTVEEVRAVSWE
jgi:hypothetical protein